ncbi:MAG: DNA mismatch repair endonuclease MutL [Candidatus Woesearchaeota archaeon]
MGRIKELKQDVIEQIAAGEVIEDPSSVVKELVENSLDAGANKVFVEIEDGGKSLIRITDDGAGMTKDDATLSVKRHATSKLDGISDLFNIQTLGFRGEALAAISSVARFEIVTKTDYAMEGTRVKVDNGEVVVESVACPKGTTVVVKDLFYNTPARKKHLRSRKAEAGKILDIITKYSLANPLIYFKLTMDGKQVMNSPNTASMLNNIVDIFGNDIAKELLELEHTDEISTIKGFISKPSFSRSDKDLMNIFINGRYVKNKTILDAVYDSYHTLLHKQRYPFAMLHINIDPKKLDVNIHPNKLKIKIEQEGKLYEVIFDAVRNTLKNHDILSKPTEEKREQEQEVLSDKEMKDEEQEQDKTESNEIKEPVRKYKVEETHQSELDSSDMTSEPEEAQDISTAEKEKSYAGSEQKKEDYGLLDDANDEKKVIDDMQKRMAKDETRPEQEQNDKGTMKILGQVYKTYILIETNNGLTIMDQHAAHERILFDQILNASRNMNFEKQELLSPAEISLSVRETSAIESNKALLKQFGFDLENFGGGTYVLRKVPVIFGKNQSKEFLRDLISDIIGHAKVNSLDKMKHEVISTMACKAAVKAGDELTREQMKNIVSGFFALDMSYTCPHGRPILLEITIEELEKRFKRTGF